MNEAWLIAGLLLATASGPYRDAKAAGGQRRMAIVVGNNLGAPSDIPLRFAQRDATRMAQTLREVGSVSGADIFLLLDEGAQAVRAVMTEVDRRVAHSAAPTILLFYYSGHADGDALHLGSTRLTWHEVRQFLETSSAQLRIAMVDTCQSGSLTSAKGFGLAPPVSSPPPASQGTAMLMASESSESAQEALSLGGSYFTHFLVSGLRGAADVNRDGLVTLVEARSYATTRTTHATSAWAQAVQHPVYYFNISGHGEVVLTDLREATALLELAPDVSGHVVVTATDSSLAVAEVEKREGGAVQLALPNGRYIVHVRKPDAIYVAEVALPWGGTTALDANDLAARSYQTVAQKGGIVEVYRHRVRLGGAVQSGIVADMGALGVARLGVGLRLGRWELALRALASQKFFDAVDTRIKTEIVGGGIVAAYEVPLRTIDLRAWLVGETHYWHQHVRKQGSRDAAVFGAGAGGGVRAPLWSRLFAEASVETVAYGVNLENGGLALRPTVIIGLGVGAHF